MGQDNLNPKDFPPPKVWRTEYDLTEKEMREFKFLAKHGHLPGRKPPVNGEGVIRKTKEG